MELNSTQFAFKSQVRLLGIMVAFARLTREYLVVGGTGAINPSGLAFPGAYKVSGAVKRLHMLNTLRLLILAFFSAPTKERQSTRSVVKLNRLALTYLIYAGIRAPWWPSLRGIAILSDLSESGFIIGKVCILYTSQQDRLWKKIDLIVHSRNQPLYGYCGVLLIRSSKPQLDVTPSKADGSMTEYRL